MGEMQQMAVETIEEMNHANGEKYMKARTKNHDTEKKWITSKYWI